MGSSGALSSPDFASIAAAKEIVGFSETLREPKKLLDLSSRSTTLRSVYNANDNLVESASSRPLPEM